jgi:hypothetical protein
MIWNGLKVISAMAMIREVVVVISMTSRMEGRSAGS